MILLANLLANFSWCCRQTKGSMLVKLKLILDQRRSRKDGTYPIVVRVYNERKFLALKTGVYILPEHWDSVRGKVRKSFTMSLLENPRLAQVELELRAKIQPLLAKHPTGYTFEQLRAALHGDDDASSNAPVTVSHFWKVEINNLLESKNYGNARVYKYTFDALNKVSNLDIPFEDVNYSFLKCNTPSIFTGMAYRVTYDPICQLWLIRQPPISMENDQF